MHDFISADLVFGLSAYWPTVMVKTYMYRSVLIPFRF